MSSLAVYSWYMLSITVVVALPMPTIFFYVGKCMATMHLLILHMHIAPGIF